MKQANVLLLLLLWSVVSRAQQIPEPKAYKNGNLTQFPLVRGLLSHSTSDAGAGAEVSFPAVPPGDLHELQSSAEGQRYTAVRYQVDGARAMRLKLSGVHLPEGADLYIYGLDAHMNPTNVLGPFTSAGPLHTGEFWTTPILGSQVVVELQPGNTLPPDVPFHVEAGLVLDHVAPQEIVNHKPELTATMAASTEIRTGLYRGVPLTYEVINGDAIYDGDIYLGRADEIPPAPVTTSKSQSNQQLFINFAAYQWPNGVIPYVINPSLPHQARATNAIAHWNSMLAGTIQIVPRTTERNYVEFSPHAIPSMCNGTIGMGGYGRQYISLGSYCDTASTIHEIGHAIGLDHEQSRPDRAPYVTIRLENSSTPVGFSVASMAFAPWGHYDFRSIMHYPVYAFSKNGKATIQTNPRGIPAYSAGSTIHDRTVVRRMYGQSGVRPASPTEGFYLIRTNPDGPTIKVDGVTFTSYKTYQWAYGTAHAISVPQPVQVVNGIQYVFAGWNTGAAANHTFTAGTSEPGLVANFVRKFRVVTSATNPSAGTVSLTPSDPGGFYAETTEVSVKASANPGYCFSSWTGLTSTTPRETVLQMSKYHSVQANFVSGLVSLSAPSAAHGAGAVTGTVTVSSSAGCRWQAKSDASWIRISSASTGTSAMPLNYTLSPNTTGVTRTGTITVDGSTLEISQGTTP